MVVLGEERTVVEVVDGIEIGELKWKVGSLVGVVEEATESGLVEVPCYLCGHCCGVESVHLVASLEVDLLPDHPNLQTIMQNYKFN